jgi:hypothetical protein
MAALCAKQTVPMRIQDQSSGRCDTLVVRFCSYRSEDVPTYVYSCLCTDIFHMSVHTVDGCETLHQLITVSNHERWDYHLSTGGFFI